MERWLGLSGVMVIAIVAAAPDALVGLVIAAVSIAV